MFKIDLKKEFTLVEYLKNAVKKAVSSCIVCVEVLYSPFANMFIIKNSFDKQYQARTKLFSFLNKFVFTLHLV